MTTRTALRELDAAGTMDATTFLRGDGSWAVPAGGSGGGVNSILGFAYRTNATTLSYDTSSTTLVDVDATNLAVTFTAPASGKVLVTLSAHAGSNSTGTSYWALRSGTTTVQEKPIISGNRYGTRTATFLVDGLTAGASYTYKWAQRITTGIASVYYGAANGVPTMVVEDPAGAAATFAPRSTSKLAGDTSAGIINWTHQGDSGYLIHLTAAAGITGSGLLGIGVDAGARAGIVVSMKSADAGAAGIYLDNQAAVDDATSYGFLGSQKSTASPLVMLQQALGGTAPALVLQALVSGTGQRIMEARDPAGTAFWWMRTDTGAVETTTPYNTTSAVHTTYAAGNVAGGYLQTSTTTGETGLRFYRDTGAGTFYAHRIDTATDELRIGTAPAGTATDGSETIAPLIRMKNTGTAQLAFFNTAPIGKRATTPDATDLASVITLANALKADLVAYGLKA